MRLISQDGKLDVPYGSVVVALHTTNENEIICFGAENFGDTYLILGKYSTKEKAKVVMGLLEKAYAGDLEGYEKVKCLKFPKDDEVEV